MSVKGGLPGGTVHVWRTSPASDNPADWLLHRADITLDADGSFTFGCLAGFIYSFTSTAARASCPIDPGQPALPAALLRPVDQDRARSRDDAALSGPARRQF